MESADDTKERLNTLTSMIKQVYLPLMNERLDSKIIMDKFVKQVSISMQQAYGNITINVPDLPENASTEQLCKDKDLIEVLINTVVSTCQIRISFLFSIIETCFAPIFPHILLVLIFELLVTDFENVY